MDRIEIAEKRYVPWKLMKHINNNGCPPQKIIGRVALLFLSIYLIVSRHISFTALFIFAQKIFFVSTDACRTTINQCYQISNIVFFTSSRRIFMVNIMEIFLFELQIFSFVWKLIIIFAIICFSHLTLVFNYCK